MKIHRHQNPTSNTIKKMLENSKSSSILEIEIESISDIRLIATEINKFIGKDLSSHTVIVMKQK